MNTLGQIKAKQLELRKAKDSLASVLTTLIGEAEMIGKNNGNREVTESEVIAMVRKFIKNLNETLEVAKLNSTSTTQRLIAERELLETFLPKQLTEEELARHIRDIHAGVLSMKSDVTMGDIMKFLKARFDGQYDGKLASTLIRQELS